MKEAIDTEFLDDSQKLLDFIAQSHSTFHVIENCAKALIAAGYKELSLSQAWEIKTGGKYYTTYNGTTIVAFNVPQSLDTQGYRIVAAHSDSPTLRIKPNPELTSAGKTVKLNTEVYGGAILYSWFDRPLSLAGRVMLRSGNPLRPTQTLFDFKDPIGVVPSLAIHFNRGVNDGFQVDKQNDMEIVVNALENVIPNQITLAQYVAQELGVKDNDILDYELYAYDTTPGCIVGLDKSMLQSPKLDNLEMAYAALRSMIDSPDTNRGKMVVIFDNEEVGSGTKQGAGSPILADIIKRICSKLRFDEEQLQTCIYNSFLVSADMAHAVHPNQAYKHDPTNHPVLNGGPVVKINASQKYMTDADSSAVFISICKEAHVPVQQFVNRSDIAGGSTLGNILTSQLAIRGVDIGNPMLAMHSSREVGGVMDTTFLMRALRTYFTI